MDDGCAAQNEKRADTQSSMAAAPDLVPVIFATRSCLFLETSARYADIYQVSRAGNMKKPARKVFRLQDVAKIVGIAAITLRRWLLSSKIPEVARDRNGWRVFTQKDVRRIQEFATMRKPPHK